MGRVDRLCMVCGTYTDNAICWDCHEANKKPCPDCGKPTPTITRMGKTPKNPTCVSCTSRLKADTRRVGKKCKICGQRYKTTKPANVSRVCQKCLSIKTKCPICKEDMSLYTTKAKERKYCSNRCTKLAYPVTTEQAKRAQITRFKDHVYKSHQNEIARGKKEYYDWRKAVFERDDYTCQDCGARNQKGSGKTIKIHPHHIEPFATNHELRYEVSNGVTLCKDCHQKKHKHIFIGRTKRKPPSNQLMFPTF